MAEEAIGRVGLHFDPRRKVGDLSPAEKTGVAVARALQYDTRSDGRLLVLDEPTATLPDAEVSRLLEIVNRVAATGVGVLYVTHRIDEVFEICDMATILRDGILKTTAVVSGLSRERLVHELVGSEFDDLSEESAKMPTEYGPAVLTVASLRAGSVRDVSVTLRVGEVVGVAGITGSGREALCSAIFGAIAREEGSIEADGVKFPPMRPDRAIAAGVAMLPSDRRRHGGFLDLTARENITITSLAPYWQGAWLRQRLERQEARKWFQRLDVRPPFGYDQKLGTFSGGNQQKILFGKWLRCGPKVLLVDEPTQGVDIGAKATLHRELLDAARSGTAVLVSSSDTDELVALCHRVLVLRRGRVAAELSGSMMTAPSVARECVGQAKENFA
jgi:ribose transport system ATP-binding protein